MLILTEAKLADQIIKAILLLDPQCYPQYVEERSLVFIPERPLQGQSSTTIDLSDILLEWKNLTQTDRAERIKELVEVVLNPPILSIDERLANLRLRARTPEELNYRQHNPSTQSGPAPTLYIEHGIVLELVEDSKSHIRLATADALEELSITPNEAYKMAAAAHHRETDANQWQTIGDVWMSTYHDDYDFARLLIAGNNNRFPFGGTQIIAYAPSHSVCLITDQEDAHTLETLVSIGDQLSADQRTLSRHLWTLNNSEQWVSYEQAIDADAARVLKLQEIREYTLAYSEQQNLLEQEFEAQDTHVASYVGFETDSGDIFSNTTYTLNEPTLLPQTDIVSLYDNDVEGIIGMLTWEEFSAFLGDALLPLSDQLPARYSLGADVNANQIESIRANFYKKSA